MCYDFTVSDPVTGLQQTILIKDEGNNGIVQESPVSLAVEQIA
jgi:hypothetical protein